MTTLAPQKTGTTSKPASAFSARQLLAALPGALRKLDPRQMWRNPVMLLVEAGAVLTTAIAIAEPFIGGSESLAPGFTAGIAVWLWITVIFANLAESVAEGRGKAQAATLRATRTSTPAHRLGTYVDGTVVDGTDGTSARVDEISSADLRLGDVVVVSAGEVIPGDGDIVWGIASVDESAITGESAPVVREHGGDRSAVTGGTRVLSDRIVVRITSKPGETFVDRMIRLVEGAARQKTPNEIALSILLSSLTIVFLIVVLTLNPMSSYAGEAASIPVLVALLVCLIPTTIGALLSAIGIAGMDRLVQRNVLAMSGRAVEAAGDVNTLLLDKTGTITYGNRQASEFIALGDTTDAQLADAARTSSLGDPTPEGASVVTLAGGSADLPAGAVVVPFTAQTRMSGVDLADGSAIRKGAGSMIAEWVGRVPASVQTDLDAVVTRISESGGTPLVVATKARDQKNGTVLGVIHLKDVVKAGS